MIVIKRISLVLATSIAIASMGLYVLKENTEINNLKTINTALTQENNQLKIQLTDYKNKYDIKTKPLEDKINQLNLKVEDYQNKSVAYENKIKELMSIGRRPKHYKLPENTSRGDFERCTLEPVGEWLLTYYAPTIAECSSNKGITRSGKEIIPGKTIAIDPKYWKFGQKFYIEGIGFVEAWDTGSAIKGEHRADIATFSTLISNDGGCFKAKVYLVKER